MGILKQLKQREVRHKVFYDRVGEPMHLNLLSLLVGIFGSFRHKVEHDLVPRAQNAFCILSAADQARQMGLSHLNILEFGVAAGAGLVNMCAIAKRVSSITGVEIKVYGFDTGKGMPPPVDYRDHPDYYITGDFPMDLDALRKILPANGELVIGDLSYTVPQFLNAHLSKESPLGYVMLDVDYYSSSVAALKLLEGDPQLYLPTTLIYLDDIHFATHNPYAGELLAVSEFNERNKLRKISRYEFLDTTRLFRRARWIKHVFVLQVMDHPTRNAPAARPRVTIPNPYL